MNRIRNLIKNAIMVLGLIILFSTQLFADDIAIFEAEPPIEPPNILLVMDVSGSMAWEVNSQNTPSDPADSRLSILRNALSDLLTDPDMVDINVGLMSFSGHSGSWLGHGPSYPVAPIDGDAALILNTNPLFTHPGATSLPAAGGLSTRGYIQEIANGWSAQNGTPIVDALFEAAKYMRGEDIHWGNQPPEEIQAAHPSTYTGLFIANGTTSSTFQCTSEACDGTSGVACNERKTCNTSSNTTTNTCSTPTCGTTCTPQVTSLTCPAAVTFCGDANNATQCTTTVNPAINHPCTDVSDLACLAANPTWTSCTLVTAGVPNSDYTCQEAVPDTVVCPATEYSCSTTTTTTTCTHEICGTITTSGVDYNSPITKECQNNAIILLSDGEPTVNDTSPLVASMVGSAYSNNCDTSSSDDGRCGVEIARFLAETDNSTLAGDQPINTYTVGFALSATSTAAGYLRSLADAGGGTFATADSSADLIRAFKDAISGANTKARSFRSPTYTPNSDSILAHGDVVYLPLFNRESTANWSGNLKKFKIIKGRLVDSDDPAKMATSDSGVLNTAKDEWATATISHAVKEGGAASKIDRTGSTRVYTDNGQSGTAAALSQLDSSVTKEQLGSTEAERLGLISFIRGKDEQGNLRHHMGDIIHSKPVHVEIAGQGYIFVGSNEGYLHAFKEDGTEAFAYMPSELLKNIKKQKYPLTNQDNHVYGVDGEITVWKGKLNSSDTNDKTLLFFGLRRGGKAYYALDVSNPASPSLVWKITPSMNGFSDLGYTWSKPKIVKVRTSAGADPKNVMIVGGGYVDDNNGEADTEDGSDVYVIDIANANVVWKTADTSPLVYAVPGGVRVIDVDRNGLADRLYFADVGGNIWRVDLDFNQDINNAKLYHFANLGGTAPTIRKFFNEPDVAFFRHAGQYLMSIAIGSGDRPNPLDEGTDDRFFALFDNHPFKYSATETPQPTAIVINDLVAAPVATGTDLISSSRSKKGWHFDFNTNSGSSGVAGEKVLSPALTFDNKVMFTSFGSGAVSVDPLDSCKTTSSNQSHLYVLDLFKAKAVIDLDETTGDDLFVGPIDDIPDAPQIFIPPPENCTVDNCSIVPEASTGTAKPVDLPSSLGRLPKVYWLDRQKN